MQSACKQLPRKLSQQARLRTQTTPNLITTKPICSVRPLTTTTPKMSLFSRNLYPDTSFTPLFRLLDDFDNYRSEVSGSSPSGQNGTRRLAARTFNPKFDVRETENSYELHGELPGIERENVNIEFTEPQTIVIHGRVERTYQSGTPPAGAIEGGAQMSGAITESGEQEHHKPHKVTVEDENPEQAKDAGTVTKHQGQQQQQRPQQQQQQPKEKFWVSERSIGEFSRTFSFPSRVDQDGVQASLNNGVLSIIVPKAKKHETRRIQVS